MLVTYRRSGGQRPPVDDERLEIAPDGSFSMRRTVGWATRPPTAVGSFAGRIPQEDLEFLRSAVELLDQDDATEDEPLLPPDSAIEQIATAESGFTLGIHELPPGPRGALASTLRRLLVDLTELPVAAVALEIDASGDNAILRHLGTQQTEADFESLFVECVRWSDDMPEDTWQMRPGALGLDTPVEASPGWSLAVPLDHGFTFDDGDELGVDIIFVFGDDPSPVWFHERRVVSQDPPRKHQPL